MNLLAAAALIASQIGVSLPAEAPVVPAPAASLIGEGMPSRVASLASGPVSASGTLSGSGFMHCNGGANGSGWMTGSVSLTSRMTVSGPDGVTATVPVSAYVFLSGSCLNGSGFVTGNASVTGSGPLYDRDGRRAGTVDLRGSVFINQHVAGFAWINQYATVTGYFTADPR
jgi:hypothetical protein